MRRAIRSALSGVAVCLAGCIAATDDGPAVEVGLTQEGLSATGYGSVAWEELDGATISELRGQLQHLEGRDIALTLHWPAAGIDDNERFELVREAYDRGIPVYPWLTLPESMGYFPNATNYNEWISSAQFLMFLWRAAGLPATTFIVDMEMSKSKLHEFQRLTAAGDPFAVARFLNRNIDRSQYADAAQAYSEFVDYAHNLGFKVALTTLLPLLEDYSDGDDFLRQGFNSPIDGPAWDEVSFQVHRTIYAASYPVTSFMVYEYGRIARQRFGARASVGIGLTHRGIAEDSSIVYPDGNQLRLDAEAALAAGLSPQRIGVYSFLGMYRRAPISQWFQTARSRRPARDLGTGMLRASMQLLDTLDGVR